MSSYIEVTLTPFPTMPPLATLKASANVPVLPLYPDEYTEVPTPACAEVSVFSVNTTDFLT